MVVMWEHCGAPLHLYVTGLHCWGLADLHHHIRLVGLFKRLPQSSVAVRKERRRIRRTGIGLMGSEILCDRHSLRP